MEVDFKKQGTAPWSNHKLLIKILDREEFLYLMNLKYQNKIKVRQYVQVIKL